MNNELDSITSTKEYKINQYNILILLVKFACITMGFYGGIMGIWTVVAGEWNERCMLKTPIEEDKNDNITSASDKMIIHEATKLSRVEVHDNYEENTNTILHLYYNDNGHIGTWTKGSCWIFEDSFILIKEKV